MKPAIFLIALSLCGTVQAKSNHDPLEPAQKPDLLEVARLGVRRMLTIYYDPGSAQIRWVSGFQWGYTKPIIGKRDYGWIACGYINAKNRMGGYTGEQLFYVFTGPSGEIYASTVDMLITSCTTTPSAPVPDELARIGSAPPNVTAAATPSIADELKKLAELRDSGVLTETEFQAQKERLLAK